MSNTLRLYPGHTLKSFCEEYAYRMNDMVDISHNYKCHKIEANYDDFQERSLNPLNSTIYYFFFSSNRWTRSMAGFLLSAARYPNEKLRKAYINFFSQ